MPKEPASKGAKRPIRVGKYEVIAHIATGGMGAVYKAVDTDLRRLVALKILSPELAAKPNMVERFRREGRSAAKLRHDNIVSLYDSGEFDGTYYLALEFIDGKDLHDYIARRGPLQPAEAKEILIQAARALDHAHRNNVIHRDIKPSNFLVTMDEAGKLLVKLTDLGLARLVSDDEFRVTKADATIGTVDYMAPEQAQDSGSADIRSDIYSLGCTLYHMLAGHCPFPTGNLVDRIMKHREEQPADIRTLNPHVPVSVAFILQKMLAKRPQDRFQTPKQLLAELENPGDVGVSFGDFEPELRPLDPGPRPAREPDADVPSTINLAPREKTKECARPAKPVRVAKKRSREHVEPPRAKKNKPRLPAWWPWAAGWAFVLLVALILWPLVKAARDPVRNDDAAKNEQTGIVGSEPSPARVSKLPPDNGEGLVIVGPEAPSLARLNDAAPPLTTAALRQEMLGPLQTAPSPPAEAQIVKVKRLSGPGEYRSLADAVAKTEGPLVIEIHDRGPLMEPALPAVRGRAIWIKGGDGFRPLLAWDVSKASTPFISLSNGSLALEGLDVVAKWSADARAEPGCVFQLHAGRFHARDCTFSVGGAHPGGLALVRADRPLPNTTAGLGTAALEAGIDPSLPVQVSLQRCYVRGSDLVVLDARDAHLDALFEGSLLVVGNEPMIRIVGSDEENITLRLVRSTLVCGQNCIRWNNRDAKPSAPHLRVLVWDALVARANPNAPQGDMLFLGDGANLVHAAWRPVNCLYAGWKRLLFSGDKSVAAGAIDTWRAVWGIRNSDKELTETWPPQVSSELETLPMQVFSPYDTPVAFAASASSGPLGCELGRLPAEPHLIMQRTYERYPMPRIALPEKLEPPVIPVSTEDVYQGERLDVTKADLGKVLQDRLRAQKPGPVIVMHLAGWGKQYTSPIQVKGVPKLILCFEGAPVKQEPLTLLLGPQAGADSGALIDIEGGSLELINARLLLDAKRTGAFPSHLIRLAGGNLVLNRCHLQGAVTKAAEAFQGLIHIQGAVDGADALPEFAAQDTVLVSSRSLLDLSGDARVRMRNCVALAAEDGFVVSAGPSARPKVFVQLEHNTLAAGQDLIRVRADMNVTYLSEGIIIHAHQNYFVNPFAGEPRRARLLRVPGQVFAQGFLLWQGKGNAYDHLRLQGYFAADMNDAGKQTFKDWQQLWGTPGEQDARLLDSGKQPKAFTVDLPFWQYLSLPAQVRVGAGPPPHGADLVALGLVKRKG